MESKKYLLALAIKYKGNWNDIYNAISQREELEGSYMLKVALDYEGKYITILDEEYPEHLRQSVKAPFVLFYEGNIKLLKDREKQFLALNDTKHTKSTDKQVAEKLMTKLPDNTAFVIGGNSPFSCNVVRTQNKPVVVVLPCSIDLFKDTDFKDQILKQNGVFVSEYPNNTEMTKDSVLLRYRIMASLCNKVLVLSHIKRNSGTKLLIGLALSQGKDIMVVPTSPLDNEESANNELIAEGAIPVYDNDSLYFNLVSNV